jgi:hypothetical protein
MARSISKGDDDTVSRCLALAVHALLELGDELGLALLLESVGFKSIASMNQSRSIEWRQSYTGRKEHLNESHKHSNVGGLGIMSPEATLPFKRFWTVLALEGLRFLSPSSLPHLKVTLGLGVAKSGPFIDQLSIRLVVVRRLVIEAEDQVVFARVDTNHSTALRMLNEGSWQFIQRGSPWVLVVFPFYASVVSFLEVQVARVSICLDHAIKAPTSLNILSVKH